MQALVLRFLRPLLSLLYCRGNLIQSPPVLIVVYVLKCALMCMQNIAIRETSEGQIFVAGAADEAAESGQEAIRLLEVGSLSRATGDSCFTLT